MVVGYAGRDRAAVEHHIDELADLGVPRPPSVPYYMMFPPWLVTQETAVTVAGAESSGEAEVVIVVDGADVFVNVGSDHTDRALEAVDIAASKGVCPKPVGRTGWTAESLEDSWDSLRLSSRIDGDVAYQDGPVAANVAPLELVAAIPWAASPPSCFVAFTGTVPVMGGIRPSTGFHAELSGGPGLPTLQLTYETIITPQLGP